jgi:hypothetical protein
MAFDGTMEVRGLIVEPGKAVLEADFVGRHTGDFAGVAATGRDVRVPYAVVYELDADRIRALRIYLAPEQIVAQLDRDRRDRRGLGDALRRPARSARRHRRRGARGRSTPDVGAVGVARR